MFPDKFPDVFLCIPRLLLTRFLLDFVERAFSHTLPLAHLAFQSALLLLQGGGFSDFIPIHIHWRRDRVAAPPCHQRMPTVWVEQPFIDRNGEQHIPMAVIAQTPVAATLSCPRAPNIINVYLALPGQARF